MIQAPEAKPADRARKLGPVLLAETSPDRDAILLQLEKLLASNAFRSSKRVSGMLRYIVEQTLDNGGAELKERTIGVHVFGRPVDYDTSAEPVVRVSAGDLRKRIAQYYHEPGHENDVRIDLPTGSYHPVFLFPAVSSATSEAVSVPAALPFPVTEIIPPAPAVEVSEKQNRRAMYSLIAGLAAALTAAGVLAVMRLPGNAYEQFWGPVLAEKGSVMIYAGRPGDQRMVVEDAIALVDLAGDLRVRNKPYRILTQSELTPETLKAGPSLLIGGFTNPVSRRLTQQLRFTFAHEGELRPASFAFIQDRQNLNRKDWSVSGVTGDAPTFTDYAIISRVIDPVTDRLAVVSAGIRRYGTLAAAEFLSRPEQLETLTARAPRDWRKNNMQAVLAVDVKNGKAAPARVVASYFW